MAKRIASTKISPGRKTSRSTATSKNGASSRRKAATEEVTVERRTGDRRAATGAAAPAPLLERRQKVNRRRQIDPTTCERDYSDDEIEFMNALDLYKRKSGRMFPTCSEVLEVIRGLGYAKQAARSPAAAACGNSAKIEEVCPDNSFERVSAADVAVQALS